jgi:hypothetical protein
MKNKKSWITIIILVLLLGGCFGDRVISEVVFAYQCKSNVGVFVYETVELDDSYVVPIPDDIRKRDSRFNISDMYMMDYEKINKDYEVKIFEKKIISKYGPVQSLTTSIARKSDEKVMGKVISFRSYFGWSSRVFPYGKKLRKNCPVSENINSNSLNSSYHYQLIKKIFILI